MSAAESWQLVSESLDSMSCHFEPRPCLISRPLVLMSLLVPFIESITYPQGYKHGDKLSTVEQVYECRLSSSRTNVRLIFGYKNNFEPDSNQIFEPDFDQIFQPDFDQICNQI